MMEQLPNGNFNEYIAILIFAFILIFSYTLNSLKIKLREKINFFHIYVVLIIVIIIIWKLWPDIWLQKIETITIIVLLIFFSIMPEGLSDKAIIKVGVFDGSFTKFKELAIENISSKKCTKIIFYLRTNASISMIIKEPPDTVKEFIMNNTTLKHLYKEK